MTKIKNRKVDKSYEIYLSLYQAVTGSEEEKISTSSFPRVSLTWSLLMSVTGEVLMQNRHGVIY